MPPKPRSISAQVAGSGTAAVKADAEKDVILLPWAENKNVAAVGEKSPHLIVPVPVKRRKLGTVRLIESIEARSKLIGAPLLPPVRMKKFETAKGPVTSDAMSWIEP